MHILVIRLSALGDVAMTVPAIYSVARTYPQHTFTVVTTAFMARLFIGAPSNIRLLPLEKRESKGVAATWHLLRRLHSIDVDAVADLHNVLRSWIIDNYYRLRHKPVVMLDKLRSERRAILHRHARTAVPFTQRYFEVFAKLGLKADPQFTSLFPDGLPALPEGITPKADERWVGIAPFARYESKTYHLGQMQEVVRLLTDARMHVFLFGARGHEASVLKEWAASSTVTVVAGCLPLEQELALMAHLDLMLTMDSANMHLASLTGTRVVSFWGGTTPACGFLGYGQRESDALYAGLDCQPCSIGGSSRCPLRHMNCTTALPPKVLAQHIISNLKS